jgi:selenocysteine-specific elongation factor
MGEKTAGEEQREESSRELHSRSGCGKTRLVSSSMTRAGAPQPRESVSGLSIRWAEYGLKPQVRQANLNRPHSPVTYRRFLRGSSGRWVPARLRSSAGSTRQETVQLGLLDSPSARPVRVLESFEARGIAIGAGNGLMAVTLHRNLVLGTAGHIDHGKTALVRALTGIDTDRLPAEKQRGITIDLGFAVLDLGDHRLAVVDVPGHERFIRNMLAGASGMDLALLVVAADDSVMPQTREHLEILRLLGLSGGVVAVTKCDLVDPAWIHLVEEEVRELVRGTFLENAAIVRTSVTTGEGLDDLKRELRSLCNRVSVRQDPGLFRMAIDRSFTVAGYGTVVTGTVASGSVAVGHDLVLHPAGRLVRVRGLQRHDQAVAEVDRGSRAAINLVGVHHHEIVRGQELAAPGYLEATRILSVELTTTPSSSRPLRHRGRYRLHLGTAEVMATLGLLTDEANPAKKENGENQGLLAQLMLAEPVVAVYGQPFVLRAESPPATLGGGRVLQPSASRLRRRNRVAVEQLGRLRSSEPTERLAVAMAFLGLRPWTERSLCALAGVPLEQIEAALEALTAAGRLVDVPIGPRRSIRLLAEFLTDLEDRLVRALQRLHAARPRQAAIPRTHLAAELPDLGSEALIGELIGRLKVQGRVVADARTVAAAGHEPKLSQGERRLKQELWEKIRHGGFSPPDAAELTAHAAARAGVVPELLALLRDEQKLVEIGPGFYLDFDVEADLRNKVISRLADGSALTMAELRDLLGTTRKYAVPIGEYLDRIGLTVRLGDTRRLAPGTTLATDSDPPMVREVDVGP